MVRKFGSALMRDMVPTIRRRWVRMGIFARGG